MATLSAIPEENLAFLQPSTAKVLAWSRVAVGGLQQLVESKGPSIVGAVDVRQNYRNAENKSVRLSVSSRIFSRRQTIWLRQLILGSGATEHTLQFGGPGEVTVQLHHGVVPIPSRIPLLVRSKEGHQLTISRGVPGDQRTITPALQLVDEHSRQYNSTPAAIRYPCVTKKNRNGLDERYIDIVADLHEMAADELRGLGDLVLDMLAQAKH